MRAIDEAILRALDGLHAPWLHAVARWLSEWGMCCYLAALVALALRTRSKRDVALARDGMLVFFSAVLIAESMLKPLVGGEESASGRATDLRSDSEAGGSAR